MPYKLLAQRYIREQRTNAIMKESTTTWFLLKKAIQDMRTIEGAQRIIIHHLKKARNYLIPYFHLNEQWFKDISHCQREIRSLNDSSYNVNDRLQRSWWVHIPKWLREDWASYPPKRCLDIGSGVGTLALYCKKLFDCEIYCIDFVDILSPLLVKKYAFNFSMNNIELDPFPWDLHFDVIIFTEILEHLNFHPVPTLKRIRNLLTEDGKLYLSTPDASKWGKTEHYTRIDEIPYPRIGTQILDGHVYQYGREELLDVLGSAELKVFRFGYSPGGTGRHFNLMLTKR